MEPVRRFGYRARRPTPSSRTAFLLTLLIVHSLLLSLPHADASSLGPNYSGTAGTNSWILPSNAVGSDESSCATAAPAVNGNWATFGFAIPTNATIQGILVEIKEAVSVGSSITYNVTLRKSDLGTDSAARSFLESDMTVCGSTQLVRSYGGSSDLWGTTWTASDINASGLTVRVETSGLGLAVLNWIRVTVAYTQSFVKSPADSITISDNHVRSLVLTRNVVESSLVTETLSKIYTQPRVISDSFASSDAVGRAVILARTLSDSSTIGDQLGRLTDLSRSLLDTSMLNESIARVALFPRSQGETLVTTETLVRSFDGARIMLETATFSDSFARVLGLMRDLTENFTMNDSLTRIIYVTRTIGDASSYSDVIARRLSLSRSLVEIKTIYDAVTSMVKQGLPSVEEPIHDMVRPLVSVVVLLQESIIIVDQTIYDLSYSRRIDDQITIFDNLIERLNPNILVTESIQVSEELARTLQLTLLFQDVLGIRDAVIGGIPRFVDLFEQIGISDSLNRLAEISRPVNENPVLRIVAQATAGLMRNLIDDLMVVVVIVVALAGLATLFVLPRKIRAKRFINR